MSRAAGLVGSPVLERLGAFVGGRRWRLYYCALGAMLFAGVILPRILSPWDDLRDRFGVLLGADFVAFYAGGRMVLDGRGEDLYDFEAQTELQHSLFEMLPAGASTVFVNPPPYALLMAPLAALPYVVAVFAWWGLALMLLLLAFVRVRAATRDRPSPLPLGAGLLFSIGFLPAALAIVMGQNTFVSLGLCTGTFLALRRDREYLAGLFLGAMILKPQLALGFAVVLLVTRRWRVVGTALGSGLALVALSAALVPGAWDAYLQVLPEVSTLVRNRPEGFLFPAYFQVSVPGALGLLLDPWAPKGADVVLPIASLAVLGWVAFEARRRPWRPGTPAWDLAMSAAMALGWLASPHLLVYDLGLFLLPAWVAYATMGTRDGRPFGGGRFYGLTLLALVFAALWVPLVSVRIWNELGDAGLPRIVPQVATAVLVAWCVGLFRAADERTDDRTEPIPV